MPNQHEPVFELTRGNLVESIHYGSAVLSDSLGNILYQVGDPDLVTFVRSCGKPFQALPLLEEGGDTIFSLTKEDLALICASHSGTDEHVKALDALHQKLQLSKADLLCGTHDPYHTATSDRLKKYDEVLDSRRHNCSGKHTGMLALAKILKQPLSQYLDLQNPVQIRQRTAVAEMAGLTEPELGLGVDGCSAPNFALPIAKVAFAYARLIDPQNLPKKRVEACQKISKAMMTHPFLVAGPERFDTELMRAQPFELLVKGGAEGYLCVGIKPGLHSDYPHGLGLALKISDGDPTGRARHALALTILAQFNFLKPTTLNALKHYGPTFEITNQKKTLTGYGRPVTHS